MATIAPSGLEITTRNVKDASIGRSKQNLDPLGAKVIDQSMIASFLLVQDLAHCLGDGGTLEDGVGLGEAQEFDVV